MSESVYCKAIDIEDFSDPGLIPYLKFIAHDEMVRFGLTEPVIVPDSKQWECAMMLRTFTELGILKPRALFAGIGAGTEQTTFALASKGAVVFPTDRYLERTPWSDVAPPGMMLAPESFTNFDVDRGMVVPVHTDARALRLPSDTFDGVYSAGSIEHFGSLDAVAAAAEEIGRVLRPGGVAAISTEFHLEGPNDRPWFDDNCILFTPELIEKYIVAPSGLKVVGTTSYRVSEKTYDGRVVLLDFLSKVNQIQTVAEKRNLFPNLVLSHEGFLFCSVHIALQKPEGPAQASPGARSTAWEPVVRSEATAALRRLAHGIGTAPPVDPVIGDPAAAARVAQLEMELHQHRTSRSFRVTRPVRVIADQVRRNPKLHRMANAAATVVRSLRGAKRPD